MDACSGWRRLLSFLTERLFGNHLTTKPFVPEFQFCAGQWLLQHVNLDLTRAADAGNHKVGWIDNGVSPCGVELSGKARCWPGGLWLDFGQTGQAESRNTDDMLTLEGQQRMAHFAQRYLKLKEVKAEWLTETTQPFPR
jgi:hypothetical protein